MILTAAAGSSGYYMVDEDGRVYTMSPYVVDPSGMLGPRPGERPTDDLRNPAGVRYSRFAGGRAFWLPTSHAEELSDEQRDALATARTRRDLAIVVAGRRADVLAELEALQDDLLQAG